MGQLPSFLPALFEAFGNQSADVRKVGYDSSVIFYFCSRTVLIIMFKRNIWSTVGF